MRWASVGHGLRERIIKRQRKKANDRRRVRREIKQRRVMGRMLTDGESSRIEVNAELNSRYS